MKERINATDVSADNKIAEKREGKKKHVTTHIGDFLGFIYVQEIGVTKHIGIFCDRADA